MKHSIVIVIGSIDIDNVKRRAFMKWIKRWFSAFLITIFTLTIMPTTVFASDSVSKVMLPIPTALISDCGNQNESGNTNACQAYALAYCRIILDQKAHTWTEYRDYNQRAKNPTSAGYSSKFKNHKSERPVLEAIYRNINMGRPVILRAKGSRNLHYVVAVGYRKACDPNKLTQNDFYILDPWDGEIKNLKSVPLKKTDEGNYGYCEATSGGERSRPNNQKKTFTITFNPNGGTVSKTSKTVSGGSTYGDLPTPTRAGYTFVCWSVDTTGSGMGISKDTPVLEENITVYALWRKTQEYSRVENGIYTLAPKNASKMRLDIASGSSANGANAQIYVANGTKAQQFEFKSVGSRGYYTIKAVVSGKMLDVKGANKASGTNVQQYTANNTNAQLWELKDAGNGYYYIVSALNNNLYLDVKGAGTVNGTNVQVYTANKTDAQKWKLEKVVVTQSPAQTPITPTDGSNSGTKLINPPTAKVIVSTSNVLKNGSKGTQVRYLQINLNALGYSCGSADGVFGNNTKNAVIKFQRDNGLTQDGKAGPATLGKMKDITVGVQTNLYKLGYYTSTIDGVMGSGTQSALEKFQKESGITQNGIASSAVRNALNQAVR